MLIPRSAGPESHLTRSTTAVAGQFDFRAVLPGKYYLIATTDDGRTKMVARQAVDVLDSDLRKLSITATRGFDIPIRIRFANWEQEAPPDYTQLVVYVLQEALTPIDQSLIRVQAQINSVSMTPNANGEFVLKNVAPGDYRVVVTTNPAPAANSRIPSYLKSPYMVSAKLGETEVLNNGIHINEKPDGTLDIVMATDTGALYGRVLDESSAPELPIRTIIVPDPSRRKRLDLYFPLDVMQSGRFSYTGIPPGDYKLFAWSHAELGAWFDPQFMRAYEDRGIPIHIEADVSTPAEVNLIH
jgi:hypothetical protein